MFQATCRQHKAKWVDRAKQARSDLSPTYFRDGDAVAKPVFGNGKAGNYCLMNSCGAFGCCFACKQW